jgi:murein DD-endopeptidase MepM/ murein hydrolase activator NlpD
MKNYKTIKIALAIFTLGTFLIGCTSRNGPPASVHYDKKTTPYHVVKKGDSIASIARKYGMNKRELIRVNGLESPYRIVKGQRLLVRAHKPSIATRDTENQVDETEAPATEEVDSVPEDDDVQVKPLTPMAGMGSGAGIGGAGEKGTIKSEGRMNPETDDETEIDGDQDSRKGKYDEDNIDEVENRSKRKDNDQVSRIAPPPPAAAGYTWPTQGTVTRNFNPTGKGKAQNDGINIAAAKGAPVVAANNGVVAHAGNQLRGFGNVVLVKHDNGTMTVYAHLDKVSVKKGDILSAGQRLGTVGQTGTVKDPQLHFEIRKGRKPIDPNQFLS